MNIKPTLDAWLSLAVDILKRNRKRSARVIFGGNGSSGCDVGHRYRGRLRAMRWTSRMGVTYNYSIGGVNI